MVIQEIIIPYRENDMICFKIAGIRYKNLNWSNFNDKYLMAKFRAFKSKDTDKYKFEKFVENRPSLRYLSLIDNLTSSIYTYSAEIKNAGYSYEYLMLKIRQMLSEYPNSRRILLRFSDDFMTYFRSQETGKVDVSCLVAIHYLEEEVKLIFRASDIKNELIPDLFLIYHFFIYPVYKEDVIMTFFSSTAQNVEVYNGIINEIKNKF